MDLINIQKRLRESISESKYTQKEIAQKIDQGYYDLENEFNYSNRMPM